MTAPEQVRREMRESIAAAVRDSAFDMEREQDARREAREQRDKEKAA